MTRGNRLIATITAAAVTLMGFGLARGRFAVSYSSTELPHFPMLRASSMLKLHAMPPQGQLLAASTFGAGRSRYTPDHLLLGLIRLPIAALGSGLAPWWISASVLLAWFVAGTSAWELISDLTQDASSRARGRLAVATGAFAFAVVLVTFGVDQASEWVVWAVAASLLVLTTLNRLRQRRSARSWAWALAAIALAGLTEVILGCVALTMLLIVLALGLSHRKAARAACVLAAVGVIVVALVTPISTVVDSRIIQEVGVGISPRLPTPTEPGSLHILGRCPHLYATVPSSGNVWQSVTEPAKRVVVRFEGQLPSAAGRGALIRFTDMGAEEAGVDLQSDGSQIRMVGVGLDGQRPTAWSNVERGHPVTLSLSLADNRWTASADHSAVGSIASTVVGKAYQRLPRIPFTDFAAVIGAQPSIEEETAGPTELCRAVLDRAASHLRYVSSLQGSGLMNELRSVGSCDAVFRGTGLMADPWELIAARPYETAVRLDVDAEVGITPIARAANDPEISVSAETDGVGSARFRLDVPYFPVAGPWFPISKGKYVLRIDFDPGSNSYAVSVGNTVLGILPVNVLNAEGAVAPSRPVFWFVRADPNGEQTPRGVRQTEVVHLPPELCLRNAATKPLVGTTPNPQRLGKSRLYAAPACKALLSGAPEGRAWDVVEVARLDAVVVLPSSSSGDSVTPVFRVGSPTPQSDVLLQLDGAGRGRIVTKKPDQVSAWFDIGASDHIVDVTLATQVDLDRYVVLVDGLAVAYMPMPKGGVNGDTTLVLPRILENRNTLTGTLVAHRLLPDRAPLCEVFKNSDRK